MTKKTVEILGWFGVVAILSAYCLNILGLIRVENIFYIALNILGSIAILIDAYKRKHYQPVVLNIVWVSVAIVALVRIILS